MADFLPDYGSLSVGGRYRPLFKLFAGENWRMVSKGREPVFCDTATQAIDAAKARVREILNSRILAEQMGEAEPDPLGARAWASGKDQRHQADVAAVFGAEPPSTVFLGSGRSVEVQYLRRRRA